MNLLVKKTPALKGKITIPGSKSQSIRAIMLSLLSKGESTLLNLLESEDTQAAMTICTLLGSQISNEKALSSIKSNGYPLTISTTKLNTGNSGITTLFTLPILGLRDNCHTPVIFNCGKQMNSRPIQPLIDALRKLGMKIEFITRKNQLPILVTGQLSGGVAEINGMNSQYLSALLISLPCAAKDSLITVKHLHERPYIDMTLYFLKKHNIKYIHSFDNHVDTFYIPGKQHYQAMQYHIKGDFSSASCLIIAAVLIPSDIELHEIEIDDVQGDKRLIYILQQMGAAITIEEKKIKFKQHKVLQGITIDANDIPDLLPALAVIATQAIGKTTIYNVKQAKIKETDRIHSMAIALRKMGARIETHEDGMTIYQSVLNGAHLNGYQDHRTVMALTVAGLIANGTTTITDAEAINKTYPNFIQHMSKLGANISLDNPIDKHVILIGFKHAGKTIIGQQLALALNKQFVDLDQEIEKYYQTNNNSYLSYRQIMQSYGETYYRQLESIMLKKIIQLPACIISLGGGTLVDKINQAIIKSHQLIHIIAPRGVVFERIMVEGRPAFFNATEDPYETFSKLWDSRQAIYHSLTTCRINNNNTVDHAVKQALSMLHINKRLT